MTFILCAILGKGSSFDLTGLKKKFTPCMLGYGFCAQFVSILSALEVCYILLFVGFSALGRVTKLNIDGLHADACVMETS
jgi:hypothetical protein